MKTTTLKGRRAAAVVAVAGAAILGLFVPAIMADDAEAYVKTKRCAWWELSGDDALVVDALGYTTSCRTAKAVGNAYLDHDAWFPRHLKAAGRTWKLGNHDSSSGRWSYKSMQYEARDRRGKWLSVYLTYEL